MKQILYKVPGGKMLRIFLDLEKDCIKDIRITGDFFMHPEENLSKLEEAVLGCNMDQASLLAAIQKFLTEYPTELYGFGPEDLVTAILNYDYAD